MLDAQPTQRPFDPIAALAERVRTDGARPLLTCYDTSDGSRVEFSGRSFANWVDKTANLAQELGLDEGSDVGLPLLLTHPGHWVGWVWTMATWQFGGSVLALPRDDLDRVELAVVGPELPHPVPGVETVACSLHPLGLGFGRSLPGVTDFAEVLSQPDVGWRADLAPILLDDGQQRLGAAELAPTLPLAGRLLVRPTGEAVDDIAHLLAALVGGGSLVVVRGECDASGLAAIAAQELTQN